MDYAYDFTERLNSLRLLLRREDYLQHPYQRPTYERVRPLVITLEEILRPAYPQAGTRREARLRALGTMVEIPDLGSSYELSAYQCAIINGYLHDFDNGWALYPWAARFVHDCTDGAQGQRLPEAQPVGAGLLRDDLRPDLPDLW